MFSEYKIEYRVQNALLVAHFQLPEVTTASLLSTNVILLLTILGINSDRLDKGGHISSSYIHRVHMYMVKQTS